MPLDPATLCARTAAGDAEMAAPRHGLAIAQRRLLSFLDHPLGIDELGHRPGVTPERLERDLARLVENGLVEIHHPAIASGSAALPPVARAASGEGTPKSAPASRRGPTSATGIGRPAPLRTGGPGAPVVIGRKVRRGRAFVVGFVSLAAVIAAIGYFAAPDAPDVASRPAKPAPPRAAAGAPVAPARPAAPGAAPVEPANTRASLEPTAPPAYVAAAPAVLSAPSPSAQRATTAAPDARLAIAPAAATAAPSPSAPAQALAPAPAEPPRAQAAPAPAVPAPAAASTPASVQAPAPVAPAPAPATAAGAPVQLAAATPSTLEPRAQPRPLAPISRESPDFPREALAAGIDKGIVRARLSIDAGGRVTGVEIVESQPRRVFDRAVTRTLARWTYEPGSPGRTTDVEIAFSRD